MSEFAILNEITIWHWFIFGALLVVLEMLAPGVIFMWLGVAAIATGLTLLVVPSLTWEIQFFIFAGLSLVAIVAGRAWVKRHPTETDQPNLNIRGAQYVGRKFTLITPIENGFGILIIDDTRWKISGPDLAVGSKIKITAMDGQTLQIEAVEG